MPHPGGRPRRSIKIEDLPQQQYFTVPEVCALTGAHKQTVRARLRDGTLKGKKLAGQWRIYPESLAAADL